MICPPVRRLSTSFSERIIGHTGGRIMLYFTCSMIPCVDLVRNEISRGKDSGI